MPKHYISRLLLNALILAWFISPAPDNGVADCSCQLGLITCLPAFWRLRVRHHHGVPLLEGDAQGKLAKPVRRESMLSCFQTLPALTLWAPLSWFISIKSLPRAPKYSHKALCLSTCACPASCVCARCEDWLSSQKQIVRSVRADLVLLNVNSRLYRLHESPGSNIRGLPACDPPAAAPVCLSVCLSVRLSVCLPPVRPREQPGLFRLHCWYWNFILEWTELQVIIWELPVFKNIC